MLSTEEPHFTRRNAAEGWRLSCQTAVKQNMKIRVPEEVFGVKKWVCTVESNPNVATFIKELTLRLPEGENVNFRAGGYVQLPVLIFSGIVMGIFTGTVKCKGSHEHHVAGEHP